MRRDRMLWIWVLGCGLLAGCSSNMTLPWEKDMLDPGRVVTREPLEIPPDLSELPDPSVSKPEPVLDTWVNPDAVGGGQGVGKQDGGQGKLPFAIPAVRDNNEGLSRNEKETLPKWMDAPVKAH